MEGMDLNTGEPVRYRDGGSRLIDHISYTFTQP
jgi:hypothetical protein